MVEFLASGDVEHADFAAAIAIYETAFPLNERHPATLIRERIVKGSSKLYLGHMSGKVVFMALLWPLKNTQFVLLDYMATSHLHQGQNIGAGFLSFIQILLKDAGQRLLLEVEDPAFGQNKQERTRRVSFYRRNGARQLKDVTFILPALQGNSPTQMILMILPANDLISVDAVEVKNLITQLYREVYDHTINETDFDRAMYDFGNQIDLI